MFVSRRQNEIPHILATFRRDQPVPPFWELEALINEGYDQETALRIMAMRRAEGGLRPGGPCESIPTPTSEELISDDPASILP